MNRLREFRKEMRQVDLAAQAGCSQPMIAKIEGGHQPDFALAVRLANVLGVLVHEAFPDLEPVVKQLLENVGGRA